MSEVRKRSAAVTQVAERPQGRNARMFQEEEKRVKDKLEKGYMPFRFWLEPGAQCEITILDASLEDGFARPEHNLKGADGKYGHITPCIRNEAECPLCKTDRESTIVLFLSVLVHRPYVVKKTGETKEYSKMFLCIKRGQYNDFARIEKMAIKKYGTFRGTTLLLARDNERNAFGTGSPIANEDGNMLADFYSEEDLVKAFGHKAIKTKEGNKVIKPENDDIMPYDYKKLMPQPDVDEFLSEYGGSPALGSKRAAQSYKEDEVEDDSDDESDDESDESEEKEVKKPKPEEGPRLRRGRVVEKKKSDDAEDEVDFD